MLKVGMYSAIEVASILFLDLANYIVLNHIAYKNVKYDVCIYHVC